MLTIILAICSPFLAAGVFLAGLYVGRRTPGFRWPRCPECRQEITVHRAAENWWHRRCACGFSRQSSPVECLRAASGVPDHQRNEQC